jgi:hypothetical protein
MAIAAVARSAAARVADVGRCASHGTRAVVPKVGVAQLHVAVEAELAQHSVLERARQEVGQHVGAGVVRTHGHELEGVS